MSTIVHDETDKCCVTWTIPNYSQIPQRFFSPNYETDGHPWRVLIFPKGNRNDLLAVYVDVANAGELAPGWSKEVQFSISIKNWDDESKPLLREANNVFSSDHRDWGFNNLIPWKDMDKGYISKDDTVVIRVTTIVLKTHAGYKPYSFDEDSKQETGFVGLKNQGATCYMNSLLQSLYHLGYFRKAVYKMPTDRDSEKISIPLALQRLFFRMQFSKRAVSTTELTKSFGWSQQDSYTQHDIQELNRVLSDNLETKMKGTEVEGTIERLFKGEYENFIECVDIEYTSKRNEAFYDIPLDVKGCKDLYQSFDKYVEVEMLDGDNKYQAEGHGLQAAKKGTLVKSFPKVLTIQLKRFEFDFYKEAMVKINDRLEFPTELELTKYMPNDTQFDAPPIYNLYAVLVHHGDVHGGHYYAFVKPRHDSEQWYKFDDSRVTKADAKQAIEDNFGGAEVYNYQFQGKQQSITRQKAANAYMLMYVQQSDIRQILEEVDPEDVPEELRMQIQREEEEESNKRQKKQEALHSVTFKLFQLEDLKARDPLKFDLLDPAAEVQSVKLKRDQTHGEARAAIAALLNLRADQFRLWTIRNRDNKTVRIDSVFEHHEYFLIDEYSKNKEEIKLYVERLPEEGAGPVEDKLFLFFKYFNEKTQTLEFVTPLLVDTRTEDIESVSQKLRALKDIDAAVPLKLFEEVTRDRVKLIADFSRQKLKTGDIIVFSEDFGKKEGEEALVDFAQYADKSSNQVTIKLHELANPDELKFKIEISRKETLPEVCAKVAALLNADPEYIRLTAQQFAQPKPRKTPLSLDPLRPLRVYDQMVQVYYNETVDVLYYEVLTIPLLQAQNLKTIKIFYSNKKTEISTHEIVVNRKSTFKEVIDKLAETIKPEAKFRIFDVYGCRIFRTINPDNSIESCADDSLYAEEIPDEEAEKGPDDKILNIVHSDPKYTMHYFGVPFMFLIRANETAGELKARIGAKLEVPAKDFEEWDLSYQSSNYSYALQKYEPADPVLAKAKSNTLYLVHKNKSGGGSASRRPEKAIKIYN